MVSYESRTGRSRTASSCMLDINRTLYDPGSYKWQQLQSVYRDYSIANSFHPARSKFHDIYRVAPGASIANIIFFLQHALCAHNEVVFNNMEDLNGECMKKNLTMGIALNIIGGPVQ